MRKSTAKKLQYFPGMSKTSEQTQHEDVRTGYACGRRSVIENSTDVNFVEADDCVWRWAVCRVEYGEELEHSHTGDLDEYIEVRNKWQVVCV